MNWTEIKTKAKQELIALNLDEIYTQRLHYECAEVESQGSERYWEEIISENKTYPTNKNGLLLPWLLGILTGDANTDPIKNRIDPLVLNSKASTIKQLIMQCGHLPFDVLQDDDKPDIDIDCLPLARDEIKKYASGRYGVDRVASVGTWQSYLFKQAIGDAYSALGLGPTKTISTSNDADAVPTAEPDDELVDDSKAVDRAALLTKELPDDVNEMRDGGFGVCNNRAKRDGVEQECGCKHNQLKCPKCGGEDTDTPTIARLIHDYKPLQDFIAEGPHHKEVVDTAVRLVGKIRNAGKHAGAIIILIGICLVMCRWFMMLRLISGLVFGRRVAILSCLSLVILSGIFLVWPIWLIFIIVLR